MEIETFNSEWHGIAFSGIVGDGREIRDAGPSFYGAFYNRFLEEGHLDPRWVRATLNLAEWIESTVLRPRAGEQPSRVSVLSLGAGLGIMEETWLRQGYQVSLQECQNSSLRQFVRSHPDASVYIGDARRVEAPSGAFDVIVLSALDYVYDRRGYGALLRETARLLRKGGAAVAVTVTNLSLGRIPRAVAKRALVAVRGDLRARRVVRWGWRRTASEHVRLGSRCGLRVHTIVAFNDDFQATAILRPAIARLLPVGPPKLAVVWSRD